MTGTTPTGAERLLLDLALGLTASLSPSDRYDRLVRAVRKALPCDAAVLFPCRVSRPRREHAAIVRRSLPLTLNACCLPTGGTLTDDAMSRDG